MNFWQISPNKVLLLSVASSPSEADLWCIFKCSRASSTSSSYLQVRVSSRSSANPTSLKVWFGCCQAVEDPVKIALLSSRCLKTACFVWPAVHKAERPRGVTDNTIKSRPRITDTRRPIGESRPQIRFILAAPPPKATKNSVLRFCSVMSWGTEMKNQHLRHIVFWSSNSWIHLIRSNMMVANYWTMTEGLMILMQLSIFLLFLSVCCGWTLFGKMFFSVLWMYARHVLPMTQRSAKML